MQLRICCWKTISFMFNSRNIIQYQTILYIKNHNWEIAVIRKFKHIGSCFQDTFKHLWRGFTICHSRFKYYSSYFTQIRVHMLGKHLSVNIRKLRLKGTSTCWESRSSQHDRLNALSRSASASMQTRIFFLAEPNTFWNWFFASICLFGSKIDTLEHFLFYCHRLLLKMIENWQVLL